MKQTNLFVLLVRARTRLCDLPFNWRAKCIHIILPFLILCFFSKRFTSNQNRDYYVSYYWVTFFHAIAKPIYIKFYFLHGSQRYPLKYQICSLFSLLCIFLFKFIYSSFFHLFLLFLLCFDDVSTILDTICPTSVSMVGFLFCILDNRTWESREEAKKNWRWTRASHIQISNCKYGNERTPYHYFVSTGSQVNAN